MYKDEITNTRMYWFIIHMENLKSVECQLSLYCHYVKYKYRNEYLSFSIINHIYRYRYIINI